MDGNGDGVRRRRACDAVLANGDRVYKLKMMNRTDELYYGLKNQRDTIRSLVVCIGADKWSLQYKSIPEKLQRLYIDGYKLVIFTKESNIDRWKNKRQEAVDSKVGRLDNFIECVKVPVQVFIACGLGKGKGTPDDPYRKPNPGMWWLMAQHFNSGIDIDMDKSFYVGDAAWRENDHSNADIEFAKAIGLKFHVPEEYFGP